MNTTPPTSDGKRIAYLAQSDFDFVRRFYIQEIERLQAQSVGLRDPKKLLEISKKAFYLQHYIDDMTFFGYEGISQGLIEKFDEVFGSKDVLIAIQKDNYEHAITQLSGQHLIGENEYVVDQGKAYYRNFSGKWYVVPPHEVFYLLPKLEEEAPPSVADALEHIYKPTLVHKIYEAWKEKSYQDEPDPSLLRLETADTTPEEYFQRTVGQIGAIVNHPISLDGLEKLHNEGEWYIESLCKVSYRLVQFVKKLRSVENAPLYLLRDGIMFAEAQKTLDILLGEETMSSQVMIGRKLLSNAKGQEYYWNMVVDVLYAALRAESDNFDVFYEIYVNGMRAQQIKYPDLKALLKRIAEYVEPQIDDALNKKKKVIVVDTGLQGSVNMLTKFIIDYYILKPEDQFPKTDIYMFVVGEWFKGVYKNRFESDYYPMMKDIEVFNRSEYLYSYKQGSLERGVLEVEMGKAQQQLLSNIELITLVTICSLMKENNLV